VKPVVISPVTRCDLHLHSSASVNNDEWYSKYFGCPESYATPQRQYELCKARGMTLVTLTDHDSIDGGLSLVHHKDFFLSEEVTTRVPGTDCVMHVLVWNITPDQHEQIQERKNDIFALAHWLQQQEIAHGLAHPLLSPNWKLDARILERLLTEFNTLEGVNGLVDSRIDRDLQDIVASLPTKKAFTAGSDDHIQRRAGCAFTEVDDALPVVEFLAKTMAGSARTKGEYAQLDAMQLCVSNTAYQFLTQRTIERPDYTDPLVDVLNVVAGRQTVTNDNQGFLGSLISSAQHIGLAVGANLDILHVNEEVSNAADAAFVDGIAKLNDAVIAHALTEILAAVQDADVYRIFGGIRDLGGALSTALPFVLAADHFGRQYQQVLRIRQEWTATTLPPRAEKLAMFSDSLDQVDGVSMSCKRFLNNAQKAGKDVLIPRCAERDAVSVSDHDILPAVKSFDNPLYPSLQLHVPSLISTITWLWKNHITNVELATPGPMGLVGLIAAKVLRIPVTASFHTEVPHMLQTFTGSRFIAKACDQYLGWFYGAVDRVFAFSEPSRLRLAEMGIAAANIELVPVAVDPSEFSPAHATPLVFDAVAVPTSGRPVVLSVGRLSTEKNLPLIIDAIASLQDRKLAPVLLVVGDGPAREQLERDNADKSFVYFVGEQTGAILQQLYASARMFVFASQIDTLGLVTLEAMASGVPVLVPCGSAVADLVTTHDVGACYEFGLLGLSAEISRVLDDAAYASLLSANARRISVERWAAAPFDHVWKSMTRAAVV
jgi:glycosyltransferase involved in cell wall biosynthesis